MSTVCVVGAGAAGLITAKTLIDDGFFVTVLTRDRSPGGIWSEERVYPGLSLNKYVAQRNYPYHSLALRCLLQCLLRRDLLAIALYVVLRGGFSQSLFIPASMGNFGSLPFPCLPR